MSGDMFRKMKERITDEVNSATDRLQSMQIIDHLTASIGQQVIGTNSMPVQTLPELPDGSFIPDNQNLIDIDPSADRLEGDYELNSGISPQHQLFDGQRIQRIPPTNRYNKLSNVNTVNNVGPICSAISKEANQESAVIDILVIGSDLEDETDIHLNDPNANDSAEIDLLSDTGLLGTTHVDTSHHDNLSRSIRMDTYRKRYRKVVHFLRKLSQEHQVERTKLESQIDSLTNVVSTLRNELENAKSNNDSSLSISTSAHENDKASSSSTHQSRTSGKIKDLEKLIAKCKESLKAKNAQLKIMKTAVSSVNQFKEDLSQMRLELDEIRAAYESWTVSIAEGKRMMHQEIEEKNSEIMILQQQLKKNVSKSTQLETVIQNLESKLVNTSVAHQKERESLIRELTTAKNLAIKQSQRDHELQLERVKLDLEKSIEVLKSEILSKDEQIIRSVERQQKLQEQNQELISELDSTKRKLTNNSDTLDQLRQTHAQCSNESKSIANYEEFQTKIQRHDDLESKIKEFELQVEGLKTKLITSETLQANLEKELKAERERKHGSITCNQCDKLRNQLSEMSEQFEQSTFDFNAQLNLMTTVNSDQEKAINSIKSERDSISSNLKTLKAEFEELVQKNESLARVNRDNEIEMQNQQEHLDNLTLMQQELESLRKEHSALIKSYEQIRLEFNERNSELSHSRTELDQAKSELKELCVKVDSLSRTIDDLNIEKNEIVTNHLNDMAKRKEMEQRLIVGILFAMKNLETPNASPGSDKNYESVQRESLSETSDDEKNLPDPIALAERLSSLALDRSNVQLRTSQRLQAVLLDNSILKDELDRLRAELNAISKEKAQESICSLNEAERLQTENQALIHDQKAYEDQVAALEAELESVNKQLETMLAESKFKPPTKEASTEPINIVEEQTNADADSGSRRDNELEELRRIVAEREQQLRNLEEATKITVSDSTRFEYLKNIVYQFMLGKEPLVLARVISAVFDFDKSQVDQICKVQETVQAALKQKI